jgi:hypothetical protein
VREARGQRLAGARVPHPRGLVVAGGDHAPPEFSLAISPVMFDGGPRLFAGIGRDVGVELVGTIASPRVTHVRYAVHKPSPRPST